MIKKLLSVMVCCVVFYTAKSQITKGNWMVGGNASFSSANNANYTQTNILIQPSIGYFIVDNFSLGIKPSYDYLKFTVTGGTSSPLNSFSIGPFLRYYFLQSTRDFNLFSEVNYLFGSSKSGSNISVNSNTFSFLAGPVIYFNNSVGLELTIGYSTVKEVYSGAASTNTLRVGVGFQIHLTK
ncbi:MAG: outer membrane beta-barrel protein [Bacteroidetes bacterium]|nr:outer membrane beta-barrel protein [Bacteroidota bacterium]